MKIQITKQLYVFYGGRRLSLPYLNVSGINSARIKQVRTQQNRMLSPRGTYGASCTPHDALEVIQFLTVCGLDPDLLCAKDRWKILIDGVIAPDSKPIAGKFDFSRNKGYKTLAAVLDAAQEMSQWLKEQGEKVTLYTKPVAHP